MAVMAVVLACCASSSALDPSLDISQYAHTAWRVREGFTRGSINAIAQTPDGYLWLGTDFGLLRFDGVRNVAWQPSADQHLPSNHIRSLLTGRDGTLWIGTHKGLAELKDGKLAQHPELDGQSVYGLVEDRNNAIWVGGHAYPQGKLCAIQKGSVRCYGEDGSLGHGVLGLYQDGKGNLWVGVANGLWRWKPGPPEFHPVSDARNGITGLGEDEGGALLIGTGSGIKRVADAKIEPYPLPSTRKAFFGYRLFRDRDGGLWIGTPDQGVVHVHAGKTDTFATTNGLSGNYVLAIVEDREGSIWVATTDGLDRFRDFAVPQSPQAKVYPMP